MRFLHTSDWHVGKTLKGLSRLAEQEAVLDELVGVAAERAVDAVLVAGDLYDTATPSAEAQQLVVRTLLGLRRTGAEVVAIAGNHDHAPTFDAYRPLMDVAGITMVGRVRRPDEGGVVSFAARSTDEPVRVAALPFLSQRYAVRAAQLLAHSPTENAAGYDQWVRSIVAALTAGAGEDAVTVLLAHLTVTGAAFGGGERQAQSIFEYSLPAAAFPADLHYVALGHLHRRQSLPAPCPVHYSGSPFRVDFGEVDSSPVVLVVEASPDTPARVVEEVPVTSARRLVTLRGTLAELATVASTVDETDLVKVVVREPARAGLREDVEALLPGVLEVRVDPESATRRPEAPRARTDRSPTELLQDYLRTRDVRDPRVEALFARLHEAVLAGEAG